MNPPSLLEPLEAINPLKGRDIEPISKASRSLLVQLRDATLTYLPLLLMGLLALGTWWLARNTPLPQEAPAARELVHEPDYAMQKFSVQSFASDGALRVQIEGESLRHYPDTDTLEIDAPRITAYAPDGHITLARAGRAIASGDASEVKLLGNARVTRQATDATQALQFRGEFLHAFFKTEQVKSHRPATITRGSTTLRANAVSYDKRLGKLLLTGRVRASYAPVTHSE